MIQKIIITCVPTYTYRLKNVQDYLSLFQTIYFNGKIAKYLLKETVDTSLNFPSLSTHNTSLKY